MCLSFSFSMSLDYSSQKADAEPYLTLCPCGVRTATSLRKEFSECLLLKSLQFESSLWYLAKMSLAAVETCSR